MQFHEVANLFPMMSSEEADALADSIAANGLQEPIWTYQGKIIDGRNREIACQFAKVKPVYREWDGNGSLIEFVLDRNLRRRQLSVSQRAMVAEKVAAMLKEEGKQRSAKNLKKGDAGPERSNLPSRENPDKNTSSAAKAGEIMGVSEGSVKRAARVRKEAPPEIVQKVEAGEMSLSAAEKAAEETAPEVMLDEVDQPVPQHLEGVFELRGTFGTMLARLKQIVSAATDLSESDAGKYLDLQSLKADLANARRQITFAAPYAVCVYCKGSGEAEDDNGTLLPDAATTCRACKGHGWIGKAAYEQAPEKLKGGAA